MRILLITSDSSAVGGAFAKAYHDSGGPPLSQIIVLPERKSLGGGLVSRALTAWRLVGPRGSIRLLAAKAGLRSSDRGLGITLPWPAALAARGTRLLQWESLKGESAVENLKQLRPDVLVSVGAPVIFSRSVLATASIGVLNVHNGLLPKYRGHFGTFWEVYHREPWAYVCIHEMLPKVDTGRMLGWERIEIAQSPSFLDLLIEKKKRGGALLARVLQETQDLGKLPATDPIDVPSDIPDGYLPYPSWKEILRFKWAGGNYAENVV